MKIESIQNPETEQYPGVLNLIATRTWNKSIIYNLPPVTDLPRMSNVPCLHDNALPPYPRPPYQQMPY